jgi:hypothetical protein
VRVLTPVSGDAGTASWPCSLKLLTSFDPMSPVPPMMTSFMIDVPFLVEVAREASDLVLGLFSLPFRQRARHVPPNLPRPASASH